MTDSSSRDLAQLIRSHPVIMAPMEDVSDSVFRRLCRDTGAALCVTEFVNVDALLEGCRRTARKLELPPGESLTGIQIYGSNPDLLAEAAEIAEAAGPVFIDINCGCWIPRIARRGAGAGWLKDPTAMVAMAKQVVRAVRVPVTVKTRIGLGSESEMPIVDLARRLEDVGVSALTLHCRTAKARYDGDADWRWAAWAQQAVRIPVIVNGDIRTAPDVLRALKETGCAGAMIGRGAISHPWIFREATALLQGGPALPPPSPFERLAFCRRQVIDNVALRGERNGVDCIRRHLRGYFDGLEGGSHLRERLNHTDGLQETLDVLDHAAQAFQGTGTNIPVRAA